MPSWSDWAEFMNASAAREEPFFLYLAYDQTHVPLFSSPYFTNATRRGLFGDALYEMDTSIGIIVGG